MMDAHRGSKRQRQHGAIDGSNHFLVAACLLACSPSSLPRCPLACLPPNILPKAFGEDRVRMRERDRRTVRGESCFDGFWVGDWLNSLILSKMKVLQKGRWFILRAMGSSVPAHFIDTCLFNLIAFLGVWTIGDIGRNTLSEGILASVYELIFFPFTLLIVRWWKKKEGIDVYDEGITYRPY